VQLGLGKQNKAENLMIHSSVLNMDGLKLVSISLRWSFEDIWMSIYHSIKNSGRRRILYLKG
jgi:hypothetical protein